MRWAGRLLAVGLILVGLSACVAPDLPYAELEERYASPASRYLETDEGLRIHYRDEGPRDAPTTIVLVHGFAASLHAWEPWVARLSPDYRMVSLDLPGHGLTRAPEDYEITPASQVAVVDAVAGHLELEPFVIAGNSMGGAVAWRYTLAHPDKVRGLVLVNAAGWPQAEGAESGPPLVFRLLANPLGRALLRNLDPRPLAKDGLVQAYEDESLVTPELVDRYVAARPRAGPPCAPDRPSRGRRRGRDAGDLRRHIGADACHGGGEGPGDPGRPLGRFRRGDPRRPQGGLSAGRSRPDGADARRKRARSSRLPGGTDRSALGAPAFSLLHGQA
ncbi:MAG: alpha/beta fold hydrolase [Pseudomonadota bacterium]